MEKTGPILNSQIEIKKRIENGQIKWYGPVLMVFARPALAIISQGLVILLFIALKRSSNVYGQFCTADLSGG
jgi:hypothetical protein